MTPEQLLSLTLHVVVCRADLCSTHELPNSSLAAPAAVIPGDPEYRRVEFQLEAGPSEHQVVVVLNLVGSEETVRKARLVPIVDEKSTVSTKLGDGTPLSVELVISR